VKKFIAAFAGVMLACLAVAPSAGAVEKSSGDVRTPYECGFVPLYQTPNKRSLYNHCGDGWVKIIVENVWFQDREKCVSPGLTDIEYYSNGYQTRDAWFVGGC
jgi:hypothetical protein